MTYSRKIEIKKGINDCLIPDNTFRYIRDFIILRLLPGEKVDLSTGDNEMGIVILSGRCSVGLKKMKLENLGSRDNVFSGKPTGVYIPIKEDFWISADTESDLAICKAKCDKKTEPFLVKPDQVKVMNVGRDNWSREVRMIISDNSPSVNLIIGETFNPQGNWSGTPPHKHEKPDLPNESLHEELYYFKTQKEDGWGIQRFYSPERNVDELLLLGDNTLTFMPWGYHQVAAAPGYDLYYLFFLAGEGKKLTGFVDPAHKWLLNPIK